MTKTYCWLCRINTKTRNEKPDFRICCVCGSDKFGKKIGKKFRVITDKEYSDTNWIMIPQRHGTCMMGCGREDQLLYFIEGDPGNIPSCKRCLFKHHRKQISYINGRKIDFKKELLMN